VAPSVGTIAGIVGQAPPSQVPAGIGFKQGESARKGLGVFLHSPSLAVRQDARLYLRGPDCVAVSCVQIPGTLQLDKGKEKGEQGGFLHTQKRPAGKRARGKGKGLG
jgi:hypothetical protein